MIDTGDKSGASDTVSRSEDYKTDSSTDEEQLAIKEEPIPVDLKSEEEELTIKEEPMDF